MIMGNELDLYLSSTNCNGEDCIIIPISQITNVEITTTCYMDDTGGPEMTLTVRGKKQ